MTDNHDEPDIQDSGISNKTETAIQTPIPTDDKTLLLSDALTVEAIDEPTRKFAAPAKKTQTNHKTEFENEPTEVLQYESQDDDLAEPPDENALRPSRLRFSLVCLLYLFTVLWTILNIQQLFTIDSDFVGWDRKWDDNRLLVSSVDQNFADKLQTGDEVLSINNQPLENRYTHFQIFRQLRVGERYTLQIKRGGQFREVEMVVQPRSFAFTLNLYFLGIFAPLVFFLTGFLVFLFKPNDKIGLLIAIAFTLVSIKIAIKIAPQSGFSYVGLPPVSAFLLQFGIISIFYAPVLLHNFLIFPRPSAIARRFPQIKWLIYLPFLLYVLPLEIAQQLARSGWTQFDFFLQRQFNEIEDLLFASCLFAGLLPLMLNYLQANEIDKRRIRILIVGIIFGIAPFVLYQLLFRPLEWMFNFELFPFGWRFLFIYTPAVIIPPIFAYAIVRHRVVPVSFVIRRGLQYLLAKNALRLLLILPILGIIWNIAANPNRTLSEILLNNSFSFYLFVALAIVDGVLMRSRLNEWIDRRFFREQYNQEKILRELTEAVKVSDSLPKLSRLVSSKIQLALHPENVYLFFRDDAMNSDFSLGYTTSGASGNSANLKLAAESPLLRFMQQERGAIEFPARQTDDLPNGEKRWLREINANLLVPLHGTDGKLAGIFSLGEKLSQIPYTTRDKELLETLANQIALVHENLNLKDRMRREQRIKTEVLSRFDEGNINLLKECPRCGRCFNRETEICADDNSELTFSLPVERTIENRYRLEKLLGKGGMGAVYEATDLRINRPVAVKILSGAMFGNKDALRRFEREAQTAGKLNHRNIVTVFDYGVLSTEGAFLVMELVAGETLSEVLKRKEKLDAETVVAWFGQVLDGVEAAHKAGIIHRDLKPDNIFVTRHEDKMVRLCILDFGIARFNEHEFTDSVTVPGTVMGTFGYMPPEQLRGEKVDERSDLFATGVIIYECLHGEKPFAGKTYQEIMRSMSKEIVLDENDLFTEFFKRGLAQKPENRFASASEMKGGLLNSTFVINKTETE
ncbi:MAG: protein kinase [Acidobacteriota bacterium]|nr:protein kinase [Acidobacteriota bacterium]